jgi:hypothetical protein
MKEISSPISSITLRLSQPILSWLKKRDLIILGIFSTSTGLRFLVPPALVINSPADDLLGVRLASNILSGTWLGLWDQYTLLKPPLYSIFLAFIRPIPLEPTVILHVFMLLVILKTCTLITKIVYLSVPLKVFTHRVIFLICALNPGLFGEGMSRIYRASLNTVLASLFIMIFLYQIFLVKDNYLETNYHKKQIRAWYIKLKISFVGIGVTYALMVLTRAEAFWILIPYVLSLTFTLSVREFQNSGRASLKKLIGTVIVLASIGLISYVVPTAAIGSINKKIYGVNITENFLSGNFAKAINLWQGVLDGKSSNLAEPISTKQRIAVYNISSTAELLSPFLETPPNTGWKTLNCRPNQTCDNSGGAWFPFELRDAAVAAGKIKSELEFQNFFGKISVDIENACKTKALNCGAPGIGPGVVNPIYMPERQLLDNTSKVFSSWIRIMQADGVDRLDSEVDPKLIKIWDSSVNYKRIVGSGDESGWRVMASTITMLSDVYKFLVPILLLFALCSLLVPRRRRELQLPTVVSISIIASLILFALGIGSLTIAWGFPVALSLYALPAQPIFLTLICLGTTSLASYVTDTLRLNHTKH